MTFSIVQIIVIIVALIICIYTLCKYANGKSSLEVSMPKLIIWSVSIAILFLLLLLKIMLMIPV